MASIFKKQQEEEQYTYAPQQGLGGGVTTQPQNPNAYTGLQGVSKNTREQAGNYQQPYQAGQQAQSAQQAMANWQNMIPQGYDNKYSGRLNSILQQINNPEGFKYEFNGDNLFRSYADRYTQLGKQASMDVQGQAAGLTGGYGNSYGANAGAQAYQQYLLGLYDKGMDLRDRAYQQYRDAMGDYERERDYLTNRYDVESERDYGRYADMRNYWTDLAQRENADWWNRLQMDYEQASEDRKYAYQTALSILANGQMPSEELLAMAGLSPEDAQKLMAEIATGGGYMPRPEDDDGNNGNESQTKINLIPQIWAAEDYIEKQKPKTKVQAAPVNNNIKVPDYNDVAPVTNKKDSKNQTVNDFLKEATENLRKRMLNKNI